MPLPKQKKAELIRHLQEGVLSKRAIARLVGTTRTTVDRFEKELLFPEKKVLPPKPPKPITDGPVEWTKCAKCNHKLEIDTPCLVCYTKRKNLGNYDMWMDNLLTPGK